MVTSKDRAAAEWQKRTSTSAPSAANRRTGAWPAVAFVGLTIAMLAWPLVGRSHIVRQEPWHPVPAAYLRTLFYLGLEPVDWELVELEWETVQEPHSPLTSVYEGLAPAAGLSGVDHEAAIRRAIAGRDAGALYAASTRALSQLIRHHLGRAAAQLDRPGAAVEEIHAAQRIYRAFASTVRQVDPAGYAAVGRAWLELSTAVGSSGILRAAALSPARARFEAARRTVEDYLSANYESAATHGAADGARPHGVGRLSAPVPGGAAAAGAEVAPWLPPGTDLNDQDPLPRLRLNFEARGIDENDLFLVAYGDMLFDSPQVFGDPARAVGLACSTCHNRSDINQRFFIPGISHRPGAVDVDGSFFNPRFNDRRRDPLDIPSLRGLRFTAPYGRDGRFASLRGFTRNVIVNEFGGEEPTPLMLDALVTYMLEFDWLPAPYLRPDGSLNEAAPTAARRGEEIFNRRLEGMGGRACSTCHVPSANFIDRLSHDIGSDGGYTEAGARDSFYDTPTLLGAKYTAPYFHDGSLETLDDVVAWFNRRFELGLEESERADLTAYLEAVGEVEDPYEIFDEHNTRFRLDFDELSTFLSTLETLISARDRSHADLLLRTVAADLRLDASGLVDRSQAPRVYELADKLDEILAAVRVEDWGLAGARWREYESLAAEHGPTLR